MRRKWGMATPQDYIELRARSAFSFLEGCSNPEDLIEAAARLDYPTLALADRDGVSGAPRFHRAARAAGLEPVTRATCLGCHEDAHGKPFDYEASLSQIEHPTRPPTSPAAADARRYKTPVNLAQRPPSHACARRGHWHRHRRSGPPASNPPQHRCPCAWDRVGWQPARC